jgi:hypothetical protein
MTRMAFFYIPSQDAFLGYHIRRPVLKEKGPPQGQGGRAFNKTYNAMRYALYFSISI